MFKTPITTPRRLTDYFKVIVLLVTLVICFAPAVNVIMAQSQNRLNQQEQALKELKEQQKTQSADVINLERRMIAMEVEFKFLSSGIWGSVTTAGTLAIIKICELIFVRRKEDKNDPNNRTTITTL